MILVEAVFNFYFDYRGIKLTLLEAMGDLLGFSFQTTKLFMVNIVYSSNVIPINTVYHQNFLHNSKLIKIPVLSTFITKKNEIKIALFRGFLSVKDSKLITKIYSVS